MGQERTESLGHFEMLWDCEFCGTKGLLAKSQRHCAECGAPQHPDKRYFPEAGAEKRVDGHRYEGADRHCPACSTPQSAAGKNCTRCGAPLDGSKEVRGIAATPPPAPRRGRRLWLILGALALVAFVIWFRCIRTREAELAIDAHRWATAIPIEQYGPVEAQDWDDRVPTDARGVTCARKQRSTRQVPTGEEECHVEKKDNRDGTFEQVKRCKPVYRDEPVEDDWCRYTVNRWTVIETRRRAGDGLAVAWPEGELPPPGTAALPGARRQGARTQTLTLVVGGQPCEGVPEATWRKYRDGQRVKVEVRASSGKVVCGSL